MLETPVDVLPALVDDAPATRGQPHRGVLAAAVAAAGSVACGGGSGGGTPPPPEPVPITDQRAARFLAQASMGATREHIASVRALGYEGWLDAQFALPSEGTRWDWLLAAGYGADEYRNSRDGFDAAMWRQLVLSSDTLRQRVTLALSEILVVSIDGLAGGGWRQFAAASYFDMLEAHAFGNYRDLLQAVSTHPAMGVYLTFRGNVKADTSTGSLPDENYARELLQLFTIGLIQLNPDGSPALRGGEPEETYGQADVSGLARVFTGWDVDKRTSNAEHPQEYQRPPMAQVASRHELGEKTFLGTTIPAGTDGAASLTLALDAIHAHANVAPFISRQLIQRLVTSNPSGPYVARVAAVFNNNGAGVKGDLKAVLKAVLLDDEARSDSGLSDPAFGKLREPVLRFLAWARAFKVDSPSNTWPIPNTSDPGTRLGQSPGRSPSVFNFFRPGYVPPNSPIGASALVAPEFQITNESSVVGYVNYMQRALSVGVGDVRADYGAVLPLATDAQALLDELNLVLAAGQLSAATLSSLKTALESIDASTETGRANRLYAALTLVLACPEFITQK